ncbi:MAG: hypothetical protein IJW54_03485 [Clostridia bacterium]|nr:hypothetical protein [Clostridia bacterium]
MKILVNDKIAEKIESITGVKTLGLKPYDKLDKPICSHADMLICIIDKTIFCYSDYYEKNIDVFAKITGYNIIKSNQQCKAIYPYDIGLNVLVIGKRIFCKKAYVVKEILDYAEINHYKIINVNQGYSCCSTLAIDENSAITSDKGMFDALVSEGIDTLLVSNCDIKLEGYNCGFVGGSGYIFDKTLYFFGSIDNLREKSEVKQWLRKRNYKLISIFMGDVSDFGGAKLVYD